MDKNDRKAALETELGFYKFRGEESRARQVREQLNALEPKKKEAPERDAEKAERAVVEPASEKAVVRRGRPKKAE